VIVSERCYVPQTFALGRIGTVKRKLLLSLIQLFYKKADVVTANSVNNVRFLSKFVGRGPFYAQLPNAIDVDRVEKLAQMQAEIPLQPVTGPHLLALGRLDYQKGFDLLLQAFSLLRRQHAWSLTIVGDGPEKECLWQLAKHLGVEESIQWVGTVINPFPYYRWADLVLLPSRFEGFPNVALEAMACGRTVICADCQTGPSELTEGGRYGILVKQGDIASLANSISKVGQDTKARTHLGRLAQEHVRHRYDLKQIRNVLASVICIKSETTRDTEDNRQDVLHAHT